MKREGFTAVSMIVAVLIICAMIILFLHYRPSLLTGVGPDKPLPEAAQEKAWGVRCRGNLRQIRAAIVMFQASNLGGGFPPSLESLASEGVSGKMLNCPVGGKHYSYDPVTGRVWCSHPGHRNF